MYIEYANNLSASDEILCWIGTTLKNYLLKHPTRNQTEIEHTIDYLCSGEGPNKLKRMSYIQAKDKAEAWLKTQSKKGKNIKEVFSDIEVIHKFKDGSRIVKLIGENAFKREGFLMNHCVASYYGKSNQWVYSYRDRDNNPHATFEVINNGKDIQQIKGKGNGSIHPKYIEPILIFLKSINFEVRDSEMQNLGYFYLDKKMKALVSEFYGKIHATKLGNKEYIFGG